MKYNEYIQLHIMIQYKIINNKKINRNKRSKMYTYIQHIHTLKGRGPSAESRAPKQEGQMFVCDIILCLT